MTKLLTFKELLDETFSSDDRRAVLNVLIDQAIRKHDVRAALALMNYVAKTEDKTGVLGEELLQQFSIEIQQVYGQLDRNEHRPLALK